MRTARIPILCLLVLLAAFFLCAAGAESDALSGVVRDSSGKPLAGVEIALTSVNGTSSTYRTTTALSGEFRFHSLAAGDYKLAAELSGYVSQGPLAVRIESSNVPVTADLTLTRSTSAPEPDGQKASRPPLEFQTAGIRGLIDPGGYSASTSGAASGLLRGIADIRRTDRSFDAATLKNWPCELEPRLEEAVAARPDNDEANRSLGQFYAAHQQPAKAIPFLKRALQIDGTDRAASRELATAQLQSGDFENARKTLTPLVEHQAEPELHQLLARADEGSGMFHEAAREYRTAEQEEPSEESLFGEGYELVLAGSPADGIVVFEAGLQKFPRSIPLCIGAGTAQYLLGKSSDGLRTFLDATDMDPDDPRPYTFLANALGASSELGDRIEKSFRRYLDRKPDSGPANLFYALALARSGSTANSKEIEVLLKRAIQLDPSLAKAHLQLGKMLAGRDDYQGAVPELEAAVRLAPDLSEAHYRLALAYSHTGRADQAAREMELFRFSKNKESAAAGGEGIDVSQFISVMDAPGESSSQEFQCPISTH